jgi:hypothetical protein
MNNLKIKILNWCLKHLFNSITEDDVLRFNGKVFIVGDKILPDTDSYDIISGADGIKNSYIWQLLVKDMKSGANKMMYEKSNSTDDMIFGKACLYVISVLESKLDNLAKIQWKK